MKKVILILFFISGSTLMLAQTVASTIEFKPISLSLNPVNKQQNYLPNRISYFTVWNTPNYTPVIKNHPFGDYTYNYLNPNQANTAGESVLFGLVNCFFNNTVNRK